MDEKEQKQLLMDLDVVMRSSDCPYIVQFYGALFREVRGLLRVQNAAAVLVLTHLGLCSRATAGSAWSSWLPR